jgi:hypothetical protein
MVKPVRECSVEKALLIQVKAKGGIAEKVTTIGNRGFFDRLVVLPGGRVIFAEIKKPRGGVVSPHQKVRHARYRALGAEVVVIKNAGDIDRLMSAG